MIWRLTDRKSVCEQKRSVSNLHLFHPSIPRSIPGSIPSHSVFQAHTATHSSGSGTGTCSWDGVHLVPGSSQGRPWVGSGSTWSPGLFFSSMIASSHVMSSFRIRKNFCRFGKVSKIKNNENNAERLRGGTLCGCGHSPVRLIG